MKFRGSDVDVWRFGLEFNPACVRDLLFHDHVYKISRRLSPDKMEVDFVPVYLSLFTARVKIRTNILSIYTFLKRHPSN